jgi:transposase-like protein
MVKRIGKRQGMRATVYCKRHGHKYISENNFIRDSGTESHYCTRCGYNWEVTWY